MFLVIFGSTSGGHEVLYKFKPAEDDLKPNDIAIVQFDTRELQDYWNSSARWNKYFAMSHGHQYVYLSMKGKCHYKLHRLSPVWCKVKAMVDVNSMLPSAKAFVYLDSDVVITSNYSMSDIIGYIRKDLRWDMAQKPIAFNQDGPGWACKHTMKHAYPFCFNSGALFWIKNEVSLDILRRWWESAGDSYSTSRFPNKWRRAWPWEQANLHKIYDQNKTRIMMLSFPNEPYLPWTSKKNPRSQYPTDAVEPWCFCHWPGANCFITHHCASKTQKAKIIENYLVPHNFAVNPVYITPCDEFS